MRNSPGSSPSAAQEGKARIVIVDDHPLVRMSMKQAIVGEADLLLCGEAENRQQALEVFAANQPDLAIIDLALSGTSGLELIKEIRPLYPKLGILVFSMHDETLHAERAIRAGASGYISKHEPVQKILEAIRQVLKGEIYWGSLAGAQAAKKAGKGVSVEDLAKRELEVFKLIGAGHTTRQIADTLQIDLSTVETYRARIKEKLQLDSANALVQYAIRWHLANAGEGGEKS